MKPTVLPRWASTGGASVVEPPSGDKDIGWINAQIPPASWLNWIEYNGYLWDVYLDAFEAHEHTWTEANEFTNGLSATSAVGNAAEFESNAIGTLESTAVAAAQAIADGAFTNALKGFSSGANGKGVRGLVSGNSTTGDGPVGVDAEVNGGFLGGFAFRARANGRGWAGLIKTTGDALGGLLSLIDEPATASDGLPVFEFSSGPTQSGTGGTYTGGSASLFGGDANSDGDFGGTALILVGGENGAGVTSWRGGMGLDVTGGASSGAGSYGAKFTGGASSGAAGGYGAHFVGGVGTGSVQALAADFIGGLLAVSGNANRAVDGRGSNVAGSRGVVARVLWNQSEHALEVFREASAGVQTPSAANATTGSVAKFWGPLDVVDSGGSARVNSARVLKSWSVIQGNGSGVATQVDAENISLVTQTVSVFDVTFTEPMANNGYALIVKAGNYGWLTSVSVKSTTGFQFFVRRMEADGTQTTPTLADLNGAQFNVIIAGRQS